MQIQTEVVDQARAKEFLAVNTVNRPLKKSHVSYLAGVMRRGEWEENGEAIMFDSSGRMINGQHRCHSVIISGVPIKTLVIRGLSDKAFATIDQGSKRTAGDVLGISGEKNSAMLAGAARAFVALENTYKDDGFSIRHNASISAKLAIQVVERAPILREFIADIYAAGSVKGLPGSKLAAVMAYASMYGSHGDKCKEFIRQLGSGADLSQTSPVLKLRERLINARCAPVEAFYLIIKAWNAFALEKQMLRLTYKNGESLPVIA